MLIRIHDLPISAPMFPGISFHASEACVDRLWWKDGILEIVTSKGEVWRLDFEDQRWIHIETIPVL